jgi:hypothetical protein
MEQEPRTEVARVSGPLVGGRGWPFGSPLDVGRHDCVIEEFFIEGVARSYAPMSGSTVGLDGHWRSAVRDASTPSVFPREGRPRS